MPYPKRAAYLLAVAALQLFAAPMAMADQSKFEPGELLVGYQRPADRDQAAKNLSGVKDLIQVRGSNPERVQVQIVGDRSLKLRLKFPDKVLGTSRNKSAEELALLQDVAKQLKDRDGSVRYAHPNWTVEIKP
jgi:hypothetical protein